MSTEVALGKDENSRRSVWFKLVKGSSHDCETAPFSDPIHNSLEVWSLRDPHTIHVPEEMYVTHVTLRVAYFIYN